MTNNNNTLFSTQPSISAIGTLTYTLADDKNETSKVTVKLSDGTDETAEQTFVITVTQ